MCAKVREGDKRIVRIKEGNPAGCHVVIVDDLVQSGGTLIECQVSISFYLPYSKNLCYKAQMNSCLFKIIITQSLEYTVLQIYTQVPT